MAEENINVTSVYQKIQYGAELTWGAGADATIALASYDANLAVKLGAQKFTGRGFQLPCVVSTGREELEVSFEAPATYEEFANDGLAGLGFITPVISDVEAVAVPSFALQCSGYTIKGCVLNAFNIDGDAGGIKISGTLFGKELDAAAIEILGPGEQTPMLNKEVAITIDGPVSNIFKWGISASGLWGPNFFVGSATPGGVCQRAIDASFNVSFEANAANKALMVNAEPVAVEIKISQPAGQSWTISFSAVREEPEAFTDNDGVYGYGLRYAILNTADVAINFVYDDGVA